MRRGKLGGEGGSESNPWVTREEEEATGRVIAAAITVHRELGPGFLESVYHRALTAELRRRGIEYDSEVDVEVIYRGEVVGRHRLDLLVGRRIVIELKAAQALDAVHFLQLRSYLKATRSPFGLLLNFGNGRLVVKRVVVRPPLLTSRSDLPSSPTLPRLPPPDGHLGAHSRNADDGEG